MTTIQLTGGSYQSRALSAAAQRMVNLYSEHLAKAQGEPTEVADYPTPGLRLLATAPGGGWRCLYRASNGSLYGVCGTGVYAITAAWTLNLIGSIPPSGTICSMADNGINIVLVDGSASGWAITMAGNAFAPIVSAGFYGGTAVVYLDTYFILNKPGSGIFYSSDSLAITFNPLNFASKSTAADPLSTLCVIDHQIWMIGYLTTELWNDVGAAAFPFQIVQGVFIDHGTAAPYSVAHQDNAVFWLSHDQAGNTVILQGAGYTVERISTHAIEEAIRQYANIRDAEGYCYQQDGHEFYMLTFPGASKTWCYDRATKVWHERVYIDGDGAEMRHLSRVAASAYGTNVVGDYASGNLYALDLDTYTDNGAPIKRLRTFPHMVKDQNRVAYQQFIAIMESGDAAPGDGGLVSLRWSDTRGISWGNPVMDSYGATGEYYTSVQWQRLGMARDRVFELSWSGASKTALLGASIVAEAGDS